MMFSATFAREAPEKQHNQFPYLIATSHCGFGNAFLHISSHFFTFFTFFTYADLGTLGTRQGGPDLGTSGPRRVGLSISVVRVVRVRDAQPVFLRGVEL